MPYTLHNVTVTDTFGNKCYIDTLHTKLGLGKRVYFKTYPLAGGATIYHCSMTITEVTESTVDEVRAATKAFPTQLPPLLEDIVDEANHSDSDATDHMRVLYNECKARVVRNGD